MSGIDRRAFFGVAAAAIVGALVPKSLLQAMEPPPVLQDWQRRLFRSGGLRSGQSLLFTQEYPQCAESTPFTYEMLIDAKRKLDAGTYKRLEFIPMHPDDYAAFRKWLT